MEAILQRLTNKDFYSRFKSNLEEFTRFTLNEHNKITYNISLPKDSSNGISFKLYFKNLSEPYRPIDLENGYGYFFLENNERNFSRVISIRGSYADYNFVLFDYLRVTVTFSEFNDRGNKLFEGEKDLKDFRLIFNAIDDKPIILRWNFESQFLL